MQKILIIRFSSIGDIILTSPVIRCIKKQKNTKVHFLVKSEYSILIRSNPYVDKVFCFRKKLSNLLLELKSENYDLIIDLHNNLRSMWVKIYLSRPHYTISKKTFHQYMLIYFNWNLLKNHVVDRYFEVVEKIEVTNDKKGLDYFFNKKTTIKFNVNQVFIAWSIGGSFNNKQLSKTQILDVCNQLSYPIVLLGGKSEELLGNQIVKLSSSSKIYNFCGSISLDQSAYLIKKSTLVLSNDTGLMHMAASFSKPIISFWGCTKPSLGFSPYKTVDGSKQLLSPLSKRPCSRYGKYCKYEGDGCVKQISSKLILKSVEDFFIKNN